MNAIFKENGLQQTTSDALHVLECMAVVTETQDVKTFVFRPVEGRFVNYQPGQFVTLELPAGSEPLLRTYTLSSTPSRPKSIAVTVKAGTGSVGTQWMFDNVFSGTRLRVRGPNGTFSIAQHSAQQYLFVSAGSGITPMMSMLRWLFDTATNPNVLFVHCARTPADIVFRQEVERIAAERPSVTVAWVIEQQNAGVAWCGYRGRLTASMLALIAPDVLQREVFCCGPQPFMQNVQAILAESSFDMAHYHEESFGIATTERVAAIESKVHGDETEAIEINFTVSGVTAKGTSNETILAIAERAGVNIPNGCRMGICGTCKIRRSGAACEISHNGGIDDEEIAEGLVLACCTKTKGSIEVVA